MLRTADLDYDLPPDRIATRPVEPRDAARLMVVHRANPDEPRHHHIRDLPTLLAPGDLLVVNRSRVIPARFLGRRLDTGGRVEGLYVDSTPDGHWRIMLKARRFREGAPIELLNRDAQPSGIQLTLLRRDAEDTTLWHVTAGEGDSRHTALDVLERIGLTPLPPYIRARRKTEHADVDDADDRARYQTVYAAEAGSVAAPTAGLHFTRELLDRLAGAGVGRADVTLHVGLGTFKPVETEFIEQHPMHAEWCSMPEATAIAIREGRGRGGRVIAVGTTAARTLESLALGAADHAKTRHGVAGHPEAGHPEAGHPEAGHPEATQTRLLITPGHQWRSTDALLTNFHLPRSTLMAMVAAKLPGGAAQLTRLYAHAIDRGYRFYSYGDAMLILP